MDIIASVGSTLVGVATLVAYMEHRFNRVKDNLRAEIRNGDASLAAQISELRGQVFELSRNTAPAGAAPDTSQ